MVLIASIDVSRALPYSSPKEYYLARVIVVPECNAILPSFSGKVVKTLLIKGNPRLEYIFESSNIKPKPIRCSPLGYTTRDGRQVFLWKRVKPGESDGSEGLVSVRSGEEYFFILGFDETVKHMVFEALTGIDGILVYNTRWRLVEVSVECYILPSRNPPVKIGNADTVKIELRSPVNIVDPYKPSRFRRFLPLAGLLLSYNIGEISRMDRDKREYWDLINLTSAVLQETHNVWDTVRKIYYLYDGKTIPGLTGYIKYYIDHEILNQKPELKTLIENILSHAQIMGVGAGRANGFGHITIKINQEPKQNK